MTEPPLEPTTTHIGGRSARVAALAAVAVLVAFVYIGVTGPGRPTASPVATPAAVIAAATPRPSPSSARAEPRLRPPAVEQIRSDPGADRPYQFLGVVLNLHGQAYIADLDEVEPGHWIATYRMLTPLPAQSATVQLADMTTTTSHDTWTLLGRWPVELDPMLGQLPTAGNWHEVVEPAWPKRYGGLALARSGYRISFRTESRAGFGLLTIEVRAGTRGWQSGRNRFILTASQ